MKRGIRCGGRLSWPACLVAVLIFTIGVFSGCAGNTTRPRVRALPGKLNPYVLQAIGTVENKYLGLGYDNSAFTHDLSFGNDGFLPASNRPLTMCVAAQFEVLVEALNLYAADVKDFSAFDYLPKVTWVRLGASDLRGQVWVVAGAPAYGMSDALHNFGMGQKKSFEQLEPGDFINFNRENGTGHAAVFISFLDANGSEIANYNPSVEGFKYFSSQGRGAGSGLGYRYAFFKPTSSCPVLSRDRKRDCGVIRSPSQHLFSAGSAWLPTSWDRATADAFRKKHVTRNEGEGVLDTAYFTGITTDN